MSGILVITVIGTLSANDVDTATLSFSVSDTINFKIDGDKLKTKISIDTVGNMTINITDDDGTNAPATQAFTFAVITNIPDITPVIKQFTVTWILLIAVLLSLLLEIPSPSSSPLLTPSAINSSFNTLSDEWVLVVAFNVIVRMPASVLAGSKTWH
jgi:hypothetical protein